MHFNCSPKTFRECQQNQFFKFSLRRSNRVRSSSQINRFERKQAREFSVNDDEILLSGAFSFSRPPRFLECTHTRLQPYKFIQKFPKSQFGEHTTNKIQNTTVHTEHTPIPGNPFHKISPRRAGQPLRNALSEGRNGGLVPVNAANKHWHVNAQLVCDQFRS